MAVGSCGLGHRRSRNRSVPAPARYSVLKYSTGVGHNTRQSSAGYFEDLSFLTGCRMRREKGTDESKMERREIG